ncbi:lipoyl(octanoyl) transferase LipB [Zwartia hollandica]|nr:lipoyl(octanoyl) transferase LipB [Zwartia hollandica]
MSRVWPRPSDYVPVWRAMQDFTKARTPDTSDELWLVEHSPVYTLGQASKPEHLLNPGNIPVIQTDRGGQVTYHGPGQVMVYILADLKRSGHYIKQMVNEIEESVILTLTGFGVEHACRKDGAPGVYVPMGNTLAKIAALGIKVRNGSTYHGVALNVDMDLKPFDGINPCGYAGLQTVNMVDMGARAQWDDVAQALATQIAGQCGLRLSNG